MGPRPEIPREAGVTPPAAWRGRTSVAEGDIDARWWQTLGDPVLTQVVETALAHNDDIELAATRVMEARGRFHLANAERWPDIVGTAQGSRDQSVNPATGTPLLQTDGETEVTAFFDLDLFGKLAEASESARAELLSSRAARDSVRLAVAASAASGYVTLRALDARLEILHETLAARADSLRILRRRAEVGYASQLDLAQAEADFRSAEEQIPAAQLAITRQEDSLNVLLGENPRAIERGVDLGKLALPTVPTTLPASLLRRRPDVVAAEDAVVAGDHALDSARAAFLPDVQLAAAGGYAGSNMIVSNPIQLFLIGGSILAPLMDSGRLRAQEQIVTAERNRAAFSYRKTVLTAFSEVEDSLAAIKRLKSQEVSAGAERDAYAHALRLATNRYRAGYSPYLDQLDADRSLLSSELALVQIRADRLTAIINLYEALGGGWVPAD
jgi:NodT family efflux transporter outer membrane factor (OMF) lipoprotein